MLSLNCHNHLRGQVGTNENRKGGEAFSHFHGLILGLTIGSPFIKIPCYIFKIVFKLYIMSGKDLSLTY